MPYVKTIGEMDDNEYKEFVGKIRDVLEEFADHNILTEKDGYFVQEFYPSRYDEKISEREMNKLYNDYISSGEDCNFSSFVEIKLLEEYELSNSPEVLFNTEIKDKLDTLTQVQIKLSEEYGELPLISDLLEEAGYDGISLDVMDFIEDEYHLTLYTKDFDVRDLYKNPTESQDKNGREIYEGDIVSANGESKPDIAEIIKGREPDDIFASAVKQLGEENFENIVDLYRSSYDGSTDCFALNITADGKNILDILDNVANKKGNIEIQGGKILCYSLDEEINIENNLKVPANCISGGDVTIKDEYLDEYYGEGTAKSEAEMFKEAGEMLKEIIAMYKEAVVEAVKAVNYGSLEVDLYFDYRDEYEESTIAEMYEDYTDKCAEGTIKETSFNDYFIERACEDILPMEWETIDEVAKEAEKYLEKHNPEALHCLQEHNLSIQEVAEMVASYDVYDLVPTCRLNIMLATQNELNIDNGAIAILDNAVENGKAPIEEYQKYLLDNGLVYLLNQQGYTAEDLLNPKDKYMKDTVECLEDLDCGYNTATTLLVQESGKELIDLLDFEANGFSDKKQNLELDKGTRVYLHDESQGYTADFPSTKTPVVIPKDMIYQIQIEGNSKPYNYTVDDVCGLVQSEWDSGVKFTDKEPAPMQKDLSVFLEAVNEKKADLEQTEEGIELD